jgi:hypothetical protein
LVDGTWILPSVLAAFVQALHTPRPKKRTQATPVPKPIPFTDAEFAAFLAAPKVAEGDVSWTWETNHVGTAKLSAPVPLRWGERLLEIRGTFNSFKGAMSFAVLLRGNGENRRIYGLCHGGDRHRNPDCRMIGPLHKHRWCEKHADREAYVPGDILKPPTDLAGVWQEFCAEALIQHAGAFHLPPVRQLVLP